MSLNLDFFIQNLLYYLGEKILLSKTPYFRGDYLTGEVKTKLCTLDDTFKKSSSIKTLTPKQMGGETAWAHVNKLDRFVNKRGFFLFCYESDLRLETIRNQIVKKCSDDEISPTGLIDAVFCLDRGALVFRADWLGIKFDPNLPAEDQWLIKDGNPLVDLISWMSIVMPNIQRFQSYLPSYLRED